MKLAIMQPYFFPYIGYFQGIAAVDKYILYENLAFIKEAWMNKNRISIINSGHSNITVPLSQKSSFKAISEIKIDNSQRRDWRRLILQTIYSNYKKAAYFEDVYPLIEDILSVRYDLLHELNSMSIIRIARFLDVRTEIVWDNKSYLPLEQSLQAAYGGQDGSPHLPCSRKVARVIEICQNEGANQFINTIAGQHLYNKEEFDHYEIELFFLQTDKEIRYAYFSTEFIPYLSIIDVLMHNGKEKTKELLTQYTLL